jgi:tetratricopeptide (TPR) repeat protein
MLTRVVQTRTMGVVMKFGSLSLGSIFAIAILFALTAAATADIIYLNTGGIVKGQIVDEDPDQVIVKTRFGEIPVDKDDIDFIERGTDEEIFQQRLKKIKEGDSDAYVELGGWAQTVGLKEEALKMFRKAIEIEPEHYFARTELGHRKYKGEWLSDDEYNKAIGLVKYEGEWVTKQDAEKLKAGYVRYGDDWIKKEDLEMARKGYRKLDGEWVTKDEYYKAKGFVKYKDKWVKPEQLEKIKRAEEERARREKLLKLSKQIKMAFKIRCSFEPDARTEHLEHFGKIVQKASETIWDMTGGGIYIAEAQIYDKKSDGDCVVKNLDQNKVQHGGRTVYGYASAGKFFVGGKCLLLTFVHEFGHAKFGLPDHYGEQVDCIMNAGDGAKHMKLTYCTGQTRGKQGCWETILKKYPGLKRPTEIGQDFEEPPETKIIIQNN